MIVGRYPGLVFEFFMSAGWKGTHWLVMHCYSRAPLKFHSCILRKQKKVFTGKQITMLRKRWYKTLVSRYKRFLKGKKRS